jgi:hypothetical protein
VSSETADLGRAEREYRHCDGSRHGEAKLEQVCEHDATQPGQGDVVAGQGQSYEHGGQAVPAERDTQDLGHRQIDPTDDDAIDRETEIDRSKSA